MKNKIFYLKIVIVILIIFNGVTFTYVYKKSEDNAEYCYYADDNKYILIEKNNVNNKYVSLLYKDDTDDYLSKIYDYESNEEIAITNIIKEDKITEYYSKIAELLDLKYPKFIAEALKKEEVKKSYLLRSNELVIYFNDYIIEPEVNEVLYLKVNYNEIKDYIDFTVLLESDYENENGYTYTKAKKSVAITFDDSPNKGKTNLILEYLNDNKSHATFFVLGNKAIYNKDLLINIKNMGNEIGSHTYEHSNMSKLSDEEILNDYEKMNNLYKNIFNEDLQLIRPPYGSIKRKQLNLINATFIHWSIDTNDWRYRRKDYLIDYVLNNIKDGDIILFHDSYESTVAAIEELLPILYSKGYQVMSVSELAKIKDVVLEKNQIYYKFS